MRDEEREATVGISKVGSGTAGLSMSGDFPPQDWLVKYVMSLPVVARLTARSSLAPGEDCAGKAGARTR